MRLRYPRPDCAGAAHATILVEVDLVGEADCLDICAGAERVMPAMQ